MKFPLFSVLTLILIVLLCFIGSSFYTADAYTLSPKNILLSPSLTHLFGTDRLGRDVLARVLEGGKISLAIGLLSALVTSFLGLVIGISAGFFQKNTDKILSLIHI